MNPNVIITCALTGAGDTAGKSPHVPVTPTQIAAAAVEGAAAMQASADLQGATAEHMELTSVRELSLCMSRPLDAQNERRGCRCASSLAADACCRLAQESAATRERQEALLRDFEVRLHMSQRGAHARPDDQLTR